MVLLDEIKPNWRDLVWGGMTIGEFNMADGDACILGWAFRNEANKWREENGWHQNGIRVDGYNYARNQLFHVDNQWSAVHYGFDVSSALNDRVSYDNLNWAWDYLLTRHPILVIGRMGFVRRSGLRVRQEVASR